SHSGIHKLGAVYISIPCIPPHHQSFLNTIFLALLFHSSDRVKFGNNVIFNPLIDELNYLRDTGVYISTDNFKGTIQFELGVIVGDNLGVHSITGFVESFSSNYPCRICKMRKEDIQKQCTVNNNLIRTVKQYNLDVSEGDVSSSGIKEACIWHKVLGFNVLEQVGMDIMHDILEGVGKYDLAFLISYYVEDLKIFTLQVLNERIVCFDYWPDRGSKPCVLHIEHLRKINIRLSASETMSLIRYFGLLIGYFVPLNDPVWCLYILLRQIIDIITSTPLQVGCCELLQTLVSEHNDIYIKIYSHKKLKPKYHFMLHYHTIIKKLGPLPNIIDSLDSLKQCTWICIKGTKYQSKMVLTLDIDENNLPKFGIIDDIYLCNNKIIVFRCLSIKTIIFYEHYFSYEIKHENRIVFVYHQILFSHIPNNISVMPNGCTYVTLRSINDQEFSFKNKVVEVIV
ncbi:MULE domain-containing protein, partial [Aphis craccivora]